MRRSSTVVGNVVVVLLMTAVALGCGGGNHVGVQNADTPSIPKMPMPMPGHASVAGRVLDSDGQGVPGATIKVAETDGTASSDAAGAYELAVPSDSTLTLLTSAPGFAPSYRESIVVADQALVTGFDVLVLPVDKITAVNTLSVPDQAATRGLMAVSLHSLSTFCVPAGARVSVSPPLAATVIYSRPGGGGLDEPDLGLTAVQPGARIDFWLAGVVPPGNMLQIRVDQPGCHLLSESPRLNGVQFSGLRRVDVQSLTKAELFLD